jgi:hypothetical protein
MSDVSCPACGHRFHPAPTDLGPASTPDPGVVRWFRTSPGWTGEASTDEVYVSYLRATDGTPVSRARFVADLGHLGIDEVLDDETYLLQRP